MGTNQRDTRLIRDKDLSFGKLLALYYKEQEIISFFQVIISLAISVLFVILFDNYDIFNSTYKLSDKIFSAATSIFGVLIAAFGLFAAVTDKNFLKFIHKLDQVQNVLFPFWFCSVLWSAVLLYSLTLTLILENQAMSYHFYKVNLFLVVYLFTIALGYTLSLIGDILKLTYYKTNLADQNLSSLSNSLLALPVQVDKNYVKYFNFLIMFFFILFIFHLIWFQYLLNRVLVTLVTGAVDVVFLFTCYKFYKMMKMKKQVTIIKRVKDTVKIIMFVLTFMFIYMV